MSNDFAIRLTDVGKMYKLYKFRKAGFFNAIGISHLLPKPYRDFTEFWALRNLDLEFKKGKRLGIIGRNGAGKSTLLKLITGNFAPTEGEVEVNGKVQALFDVGAGFHPEFTGYENICSSLVYQGLGQKEIELAIEDITDFTELGPFLGQPFKTYSSGMQARLGFAVATAIKPDILIVDEVLGAGDAYFAGKSVERMRRLTTGGNASVLIVSHALNEIIRYCEETIWLERGRILKQGPSMEVITAYEGFIHALEDRRIKSRNQKVLRGVKSSFQLDYYSDTLILTLVFQGEPKQTFDVSNIQLLKNGQIEEELRVGDAQDTNESCSCSLVLKNSHWSGPRHDEKVYYRSLIIGSNPLIAQEGSAVFYSYGLFGDEKYALRLRYRGASNSKVVLTIAKNGTIIHNQIPLTLEGSGWLENEIPLKISESPVEESARQRNELTRSKVLESGKDGAVLNTSGPAIDAENQEPGTELSKHLPIKQRQIVHWPGEGSITIQNVTLRGEDGEGQTIFKVNSRMIVSMTVMAHRDGHFNLVPATALHRLDGIFISNFIGEAVPMDMVRGEKREFRLEIPSINLGDGNYVFALAIYEATVTDESRYDLIDRCYEFKIIGNKPELKQAIFQHNGRWQT